MKYLKKTTALLLAATLFCMALSFAAPLHTYAAAKTPVMRYGRLHVEGTHLCDSKGRAVQLKGVSTHGLAWYPQFVNKKSFRTLRDRWGVEVIRLAMYTAEYNGYCTGSAQNRKALEETIQKAVGWCEQLGLYVIIDWHILSDSNPNTYKKQATVFFRKMAKKYAGHKNVLYEICNEPNGGTSWAQICSYAKTVIRTIRSADKNGVIIVGTPNWCQETETAAQSPFKSKNIMYAFHYYAATHTDAYRKKLQAAVDAGLPVFVTEYGICDASGNGAVNRTEADRWMRLLDKNKISCVAWNLSNKAERAALLQSNCQKTYGWKRADLSESGKWVYDMLRR